MIDSESARVKLLEILPDADISVIPDGFDGLAIGIVAKQFENKTPAFRREMVLGVVDDNQISKLSLMSPEEAEEATPTPDDSPPVQLPLWPESLADGVTHGPTKVNLPSTDLDALDPPVVATFYSLRGGVGRSTALVHSAFALSEMGLSVLCIDMDLEAPGLATLFGVEDQVDNDFGVVSLLTYIEAMGDVPSELADNFITVRTGTSPSKIRLLPAGTVSPRYAQQLSLLDPSAWFEEEINPLRILIQSIRNMEPVVRPDVVLIDSRTGLSSISAPLIFEIADIDLITFLPHPQAKTGTGLLTRALLTARTMRGSDNEKPWTPEPRFIISPVPPSEDNFNKAQDRALDWISEWLSPAEDTYGNPVFNDLEEIVQVIGYSEETASADSISNLSSKKPYQPIAEWIAGLVAVTPKETANSLPTGFPEANKPEILESLEFDSQTADAQEADALKEIFVSTDSVAKALDLGRPLVVGRKGSGKTLLFRTLQFDDRIASVAITSPPGEERSVLPFSESTYESISKELIKNELSWQTAWRALIALSLSKNGIVELPNGHGRFANRSEGAPRATEVIAELKMLIESDDPALMLEDLLYQIDDSLDRDIYLLFDGLDTGFGSKFDLRLSSVSGLLLLLNDQAKNLRNLHFKVFLREDIFRGISVPNKSHLQAEAALLTWNDQYDYLRLIIKQAWRSKQFRDFTIQKLSKPDQSFGRPSFNFVDTQIEYWPDDIVLDVWQILVGERMSGGKTAFTHNWVWTRLADANEDHAPRHLIALFQQALVNERQIEPGSPNNRVLIRPKALNDALDHSGSGAESAIREEFPELSNLLDLLRDVIRTTPFEEERLAGSSIPSSDINLAREVGLIGRGSDDRYRVPELYRRALNMTRKGQR